ncbi:hypothetical protein ISF_00111 [Cordyceps fumosorosea ARSEF 2679]|uniref:Uncharacterized protein n=1 Tax=Cordyceps fumosorosea (strain ARSEF 2679) TaxID=1081104 RepID=A0A168E017_CORFA|nr:hypothetical protein ISF_00111 [Cordyceps fumosorosea ARSEF 2679]OAA73210.1 hypothetical protein ISF_00111 [Cordyceps fumosorosea ARSEF 2679]
MARRTTSRSAADSDGTSAAIAAQQRIFQVTCQPAPDPGPFHAAHPPPQLKKERDEKIQDVVDKVTADLDGIKHRAAREREEHQRRRRQETARILSEIARSVQRRSAIEEEMTAVVAGVGAAAAAVEDRVMEVYEGKEREVQQLLRDGQD